MRGSFANVSIGISGQTMTCLQALETFCLRGACKYFITYDKFADGTLIRIEIAVFANNVKRHLIETARWIPRDATYTFENDAAAKDLIIATALSMLGFDTRQYTRTPPADYHTSRRRDDHRPPVAATPIWRRDRPTVMEPQRTEAQPAEAETAATATNGGGGAANGEAVAPRGLTPVNGGGGRQPAETPAAVDPHGPTPVSATPPPRPRILKPQRAREAPAAPQSTTTLDPVPTPAPTANAGPAQETTAESDAIEIPVRSQIGDADDGEGGFKTVPVSRGRARGRGGVPRIPARRPPIALQKEKWGDTDE